MLVFSILEHRFFVHELDDVTNELRDVSDRYDATELTIDPGTDFVLQGFHFGRRVPKCDAWEPDDPEGGGRS